jgi:hypothetical protein
LGARERYNTTSIARALPSRPTYKKAPDFLPEAPVPCPLIRRGDADHAATVLGVYTRHQIQSELHRSSPDQCQIRLELDGRLTFQPHGQLENERDCQSIQRQTHSEMSRAAALTGSREVGAERVACAEVGHDREGGVRACCLPTRRVCSPRAHAALRADTALEAPCEMERGAARLPCMLGRHGIGGVRGRGRCLASLPRRAGAIWIGTAGRGSRPVSRLSLQDGLPHQLCTF